MQKRHLLLISYFYSISLFVQAQNLQWAKTAGSTSTDVGVSIAVDLQGNVYTTGYFQGTVDFDGNAGVTNLTSAGGNDVFVTKMNPQGDLIWAKSIGGAQDEQGRGIDVDNSGNVYITGDFGGTADFDPSLGTANLSVVGPSNDIFVLKLDDTGDYVWAKNFGYFGSDVGASIALDANSNVYFTGYFNWDVDFDPNAGVQSLTAIGGRDIFVCKLDENANYIWAKSMGSPNAEEGLSISLDDNGNVYTTGFISDTIDFDPSANVFNLNANGFNTVYVSKFDVDGNFIWAKNISNTETCQGNAIAVEGDGLSTYVIGHFQGTEDFDPGVGVLNLTANGKDIFVIKLDEMGNLIWAKNLGGGNTDYGYSIATDALGNVYTTGVFEGTADFDPNAGVFNLTAQFARDMFICKLDGTGNLVWAKNITGALGLSEGNDIAIDASENIYTTGFYYGTVDFDFNSAIDNHVSVGAQDVFVMKVDQLPLSIAYNPNDFQINVYPNPSNGVFNIQKSNAFDFENNLLSVSDINGKELYSCNLSFKSNNVYELKLDEFAKGVYFMQIKSSKAIIQTKLFLN